MPSQFESTLLFAVQGFEGYLAIVVLRIAAARVSTYFRSWFDDFDLKTPAGSIQDIDDSERKYYKAIFGITATSEALVLFMLLLGLWSSPRESMVRLSWTMAVILDFMLALFALIPIWRDLKSLGRTEIFANDPYKP